MPEFSSPHFDANEAEELLGKVAAHFFEQRAAGKTPSVEDFANRFPGIADHIRRTFPALVLMGSADATEPPTPVDPNQERLGDFQLVRELGRGGMAIVYEAEQISIGRHVALKVLPFATLADPRALARFHNEVRAAATLDHPNIVTVYSVGEERGIHFFAMRLIRGESLAEAIGQLREHRERACATDDGTRIGSAQASNSKQTRPDNCDARTSNNYLRSNSQGEFYNRVAELGEQTAHALYFAHEHGVIHRDVKPANLMLDELGKAHIMDFGLAHLESSETLTRSGDLLGTYRYMSPEQASGNALRMDERSDIYSLGATLYEMLTLNPPFANYSGPRVIRAVVDEDPVSPRKVDATIPVDLETIVLRAMSKDPADRYRNAESLADDLARFQAGQRIQAKRISVGDRFGRWVSRHQRVMALAVGLVAAILCTLFATQQFHAHRLNELERRLDKQARHLAKRVYANDVRSAFDAIARGDTSKAVRLAAEQKQQPTASPRGVEWELLHSVTSNLIPDLTLTGHDGAVQDIAAIPKKAWLASAGDDQFVRVWDLEQARQIATYKIDGGPLSALAVTPDGESFLAGCRTLRMFDLSTGKRIRTFEPLAETPIESIAVSPAGDTVAFGSRYEAIRLSRIDGSAIAKLPSEARNEKLLFAKAGDWLIGSAREDSRDEFIRVWDLRHAPPSVDREIHGSQSESFRHFIGPLANHGIVVGGPQTTGIACFDLRSGTVLQRSQPAGDASVASMAIALDQRSCAAGFRNGTIWHAELAPSRPSSSWVVPGTDQVLPAHQGPVTDMEFLADGRLVSCGDDGAIKIWPRQRPRFQLRGKKQDIWFSFDLNQHDQLALLPREGEKTFLQVWDAQVETPTELRFPTNISSVTYSPDGSNIVLGGLAHIFLLDTKDGLTEIANTEQFSSDSQSHAVNGLAFSENGKWLATGDDSSADDVFMMFREQTRQDGPIIGRLVFFCYVATCFPARELHPSHCLYKCHRVLSF